MDFLRTTILAVALGIDAMSVCMALGVRWHGPGQRFRLAWHMGLFQFLMPIVGWLVGRQLVGILQAVGGYAAAALVFVVGAKMLYEVIRTHPGEVAQDTEHFIEEHMHLQRKDPTRGWSLLILSVATSIDALVVGFSLALGGRSIWLASIVIGIAAAGMSLLGVAIGKRAGSRFGRPAELVGAVVLMALGVSFAIL